VTSLVPQAASGELQAASKSQIGEGRSGLASFKIVVLELQVAITRTA
jgi:hypothetical protein